MLEIKAYQLSLHRRGRTLIDSLDLTLLPGEVMGILGANGVGKSSLLTVLAGLATPTTGRLTLDSQTLATLPPLIRAQHIGLLPQGDVGGFFGSVSDFVALGRYPFHTTLDDLDSHLAIWELLDLAERRLDTLSGSERDWHSLQYKRHRFICWTSR